MLLKQEGMEEMRIEKKISEIKNYSDENGNRIIINKRGADYNKQGKYAKNNTVEIDKDATFKFLKILFLGSNSLVRIGKVKEGMFNMQL